MFVAVRWLLQDVCLKLINSPAINLANDLRKLNEYIMKYLFLIDVKC